MQTSSADLLAWRRTTTFSNGAISTTQTRQQYGSKLLYVVQDTVSRPPRKDQIHPHEYTKFVGSSNWRGRVKDYALSGLDSTETTGPQPYAFNHTYKVPVGFASMADLENQCLSKVNEAVRGGVDLAVTLAEAGQTVGLRRQLTKLVGRVLDFKRTYGKRVFTNVPDLSSEAWLTWQYGIRPIISDIYTAADNVKRSGQTLMRIKKRSKQLNVLQVANTVDFGTGPVPVVGTEWSSCRCEIVYVLAINDTVLQRVGDWTSLNPVSIAWELTPYSFVADWVFDVGSYLRNMESAFLYKDNFVIGYKTLTYKAGVTLTVTADKKYGANRLAEYRLYGVKLDSGKKRSVLTNVVLPYPPKFDVELGWQRLASAASLIWQGGISKRVPKGQHRSSIF